MNKKQELSSELKRKLRLNRKTINFVQESNQLNSSSQKSSTDGLVDSHSSVIDKEILKINRIFLFQCAYPKQRQNLRPNLKQPVNSLQNSLGKRKGGLGSQKFTMFAVMEDIHVI